MVIPEYLPLLSKIKQLFIHEEYMPSDKKKLILWANKLAILQLQQNTQSLSQALVESLIKEAAEVMTIIISLNTQFDRTNNPNKQNLTEFHQIVEDFYQQLSQLTQIYTETQRQALWVKSQQTKQTNNDQSPSLLDTKEKQKDIPEQDNNDFQETRKGIQSPPPELNAASTPWDENSTMTPPLSSLNKSRNQSLPNTHRAHHSQSEPYQKKESFFLKQIFDDKEV